MFKRLRIIFCNCCCSFRMGVQQRWVDETHYIKLSDSALTFNGRGQRFPDGDRGFQSGGLKRNPPFRGLR